MNTELQWYAIHTRSRHEKVVAEQLEQKQIACFLPLMETVSHRKDRRVRIQSPLFPGYLFVHVPIRERRLDILRVPSAVCVIEFNGQAIPIPETQIESVRRLLSSTLACDPYPHIVQGDRVEVVHGALRGLEGTLVRKKNADKFVLTVDLIQKSVCCEIDACDVRRIATTPAATTLH